MAERNPAAARIDFRLIETEFARHRTGLRGECLVRFDDIHVGNIERRLLDGQSGRRNGAETHIERLDACVGIADQPRHRFQTEAADRCLARQHDGCGTVIDAGRIAGGYAAAIAFENGPQAFEVFGGSIMPMCSLVSKTAVPLRLLTSMPRICSLK
jgi:hypothetical protein